MTYETPHHTRGHFVFYYHHVTYRTQCHVSGQQVIFTVSGMDLRERFYSQAIFTLHSFLLVLRLAGAVSLTLTLAGLHVDIFES